MSSEFNKWWNEDLLTEDNPFVDGTPAYWAWEGWCAGVKAEREACAKAAEDTNRMVLALLNVTSQPAHIAAVIRARS